MNLKICERYFENREEDSSNQQDDKDQACQNSGCKDMDDKDIKEGHQNYDMSTRQATSLPRRLLMICAAARSKKIIPHLHPSRYSNQPNVITIEYEKRNFSGQR